VLILHTAFLRSLLPPDPAGAGAAPTGWLRALAEARAGALLLDGEVPAWAWPGVEAALKPPAGSFAAWAMHPPAFRLPGAPPAPPGGFGLASPDKEERQAALRAHLDCLPLAERLECRLWVLRLGRVEMPDPMPALGNLFGRERLPGSEEGAERGREILAERAAKAGRLADAARWSLERLFKPAERQGLALCLENHWDVRGYPAYREAEGLLVEFAGAPLGFWLNAGHAAVHAQLGLIQEAAILARLKPWLKGGTLHGARGPLDHLPPGEGLNALGPLLQEGPPGLPWAVDVRRRLRPGRPAQEEEERAAWERERELRGRKGLAAPPSVPDEETLPAPPGLLREVLDELAGMGF
jgi:sugar phosphate isomerase/epimerase